MTTRADVVREARTWLKTPWQHQACVKNVGVDCLNLVGGVALALNMPGAQAWACDERFRSYGRTPDPTTLLAGCDAYLDRIPIAAATIADVLVMRAANLDQPTHFAIITEIEPYYIIHSRLAHRVSENRLNDKLRALILRAYSYRGLD